MNCLELRSVGKVYPNGKEALKKLSLTFTPGIYGLLGSNGAGKSTLMKIMTQNMKASRGRILYNGTNIRRIGREYRRQIGFMPQQQTILEGFSGRQFLWYMAALKGMKHRQTKERIGELLRVVNLEEAADRRIGGYSGGMKQRILLAQALLSDPDILILDEPTAGLDPRERIRIRNFISEIARDKIVLIATHVVSDVECIAKEILLLRQGELIGQGSAGQLQEAIRGEVWEGRVGTEALHQLEKTSCVSHVTAVDEEYLVRIVGQPPQGEWVQAAPTLEDVYLYWMDNRLGDVRMS